MAESYPAQLQIGYPEERDRLTTFFRIIMAVPILMILAMLLHNNGDSTAEQGSQWVYHGVGLVFLPTVFMILFRQKYPKWWYEWNLALMKFSTRVFSYLLLLTDEYPSTDEDQSVEIVITYPDVKTELNRGMPLVKWFLAIPHIIILGLLFVAVMFITVFAWFTILFTGQYPRGLFDFVVGVLRWSIRVEAYAILLTTDSYPPFSLN